MRGLLIFSWFLLVATEASTVATLAASPMVPANYEFSLATSKWGFQFSCASASETVQCTPGPQAVRCSRILIGLGHSVFRLIPRTPTILSRRESTWPDIAQ